jgi:thioredoxin reductase (NADPH)
MQSRVLENPKINVIWNSEVVELIGTKETGLTAVTLQAKDGTRTNFPTNGLFYAIGHKPNTDLFKGVLDMNDVGYLKVASPSSKTNVEGVFAAGDVCDPHYRQAISSAGAGCIAAMDAEHFLSSQVATVV